jgi:hypothetical protein
LDGRKRINLIDELSRLSPVEKIFDELEKDKIVENLVGFIPCGDSTDTTHHIVNIATYLALKGKNILIVDGDVFYPTMYKILDNDILEKGKGILRLLKDDRMDIREEIQKTAIDNLYFVSGSPFDPMEEYFELDEKDVERIFQGFREIFDIVLVFIPNNPPLEFCYATINVLSFGFLMWSPRVECPLKTKRLFYFLNSIGVSTSKLGNVLSCNTSDMSFDIKVVDNMGLRLISELPMIPKIFDFALEGKNYMKDSVFMDKRYKMGIEQIANIIGR